MLKVLWALPLLLMQASLWANAQMMSKENANYAQSLYRIHCQGCHLPDGAGNPQRYIPDFRNHLGIFLHSEEGRSYLLQVPGAAGAPIDDEALALVSNWILWQFSFEQLPDDFQPYETEEVSKLRQVPLYEPSARRKRILQEICRAERIMHCDEMPYMPDL